jgi:hypothetical protein
MLKKFEAWFNKRAYEMALREIRRLEFRDETQEYVNNLMRANKI